VGGEKGGERRGGEAKKGARGKIGGRTFSHGENRKRDEEKKWELLIKRGRGKAHSGLGAMTTSGTTKTLTARQKRGDWEGGVSDSNAANRSTHEK